MQNEKNRPDEEEILDLITLMDEDGTETEFAIIDRVTNGENSYLLVIEAAGLDDEESDALLLRELVSDTEDPTYELIEDDEEFDRVAELFAQGNDDYEVQIEDE